MSKESKPRVGHGNVDIILGGESRTLKPSLIAIQTLSRNYGGMQQVFDRVIQLDFEAICDVIAVGLGKVGLGPKQKQELAEQVFETGISDDTGRLAHGCIRYVATLMRGGQPPVLVVDNTVDKAEDKGEPVGNQKSSSDN